MPKAQTSSTSSAKRKKSFTERIPFGAHKAIYDGSAVEQVAVYTASNTHT
jgi:hypothetical protein